MPLSAPRLELRKTCCFSGSYSVLCCDSETFLEYWSERSSLSPAILSYYGSLESAFGLERRDWTARLLEVSMVLAVETVKEDVKGVWIWRQSLLLLALPLR